MAGWRGVARLPIVDRRRAGRLEEQRALADTAAGFVPEHSTGKVIGVAPPALGVSLAARGRPGEALPLIERGVALARTLASPSNWRRAAQPGAGASGPRRAQACAGGEAEARAPVLNPALIRGSGLRGWLLSTAHRNIRRVRSGDQELTQRGAPGAQSVARQSV